MMKLTHLAGRDENGKAVLFRLEDYDTDDIDVGRVRLQQAACETLGWPLKVALVGIEGGKK